MFEYVKRCFIYLSETHLCYMDIKQVTKTEQLTLGKIKYIKKENVIIVSHGTHKN